jgi:hypothetical protein
MNTLKYFLFVILMISLVQAINAQASLSSSNGVIILNPNQKGELSNSFRRGSYNGPHFFGDSITNKMNQLEQIYTYYQPGNGAYAVESKVVLKPEIYKKVKMLEKAYIKDVKKNRLDIREAEHKLSNTLSLAIKLMDYDTRVLEKDLILIDTAEKAEAYFYNIKLNNAQ